MDLSHHSPLTELATPYFNSIAETLKSSFSEGNGRALQELGSEYELNMKIMSLASNADAIWILTCGFLVFWMQAGFAMLEAGAVRSKNTINILFKNIMDVSIAGVFYFLVGYGFAYGVDNAEDNSSVFIGSGDYALHNDDNTMKHFWFFQFAFAATAATIVSGSVAERTSLPAYFAYSIFITAVVYPVVSHWIWSAEGFLTAFGNTGACTETECTSKMVTIGGGKHPLFADDYSEACGMIDYAGSGVVHMTGGFAGLVGAIVVGARKGRFETKPDGGAGAAVPIPGHNIALCATGTLILWFGWYGFNCGSTLALDGAIAAKVAVTTTICPAMACITGVFFTYATTKTWDLGVALNCILAGLVSITAPCSTVTDWTALFIGIIGAFVYMGSSALLRMLKIDDPLDAFPVHGACGVWGCLAVGIFSNKGAIAAAYSTCSDLGTKGNDNAYQFATQLVGVICIILWVVACSAVCFVLINLTIGMRVSEEIELAGMDVSEHGGSAYEMAMLPDSTEPAKKPAAATEEGGVAKV